MTGETGSAQRVSAAGRAKALLFLDRFVHDETRKSGFVRFGVPARLQLPRSGARIARA